MLGLTEEQNTLKDPETWAKHIEGLGAGEIFFNSIDLMVLEKDMRLIHCA